MNQDGARRATTAMVAGGLGASATGCVRRELGRYVGFAPRWNRTNFRGQPVSLLEGPAIIAGLTMSAGVACADHRVSGTPASVIVAISGAGVFGLVDDLTEDGQNRSRGFRGHLSALRQGRVTTGALKILGIGMSAAVSAALISVERGRHGKNGADSVLQRALDISVDTALIAGTANLINLFDLRPGRALKAASMLVTPMFATPAAPQAAALWGAATASAPSDLDAHDMAGDGGANALGALVGHAWASGTSRPVRLAATAVVVAFNVLSERVSFSAVIRGNRVLRRLDDWGRSDSSATVEGPGDES